MKKKFYPILTLLTLATALVTTSCGGGNNPDPKPEQKFDFTVALESGRTSLEIDQTDKILITTNGVEPEVQREYTYESSDASSLTVDTLGNVKALAINESVTISVTEKVSTKKVRFTVSVTAKTVPANGGYNYAAASGAEAIAKRTEILGNLEKYAMDNHLTGITLFENGGYVKYSDRISIPADEYITGYGYGILSEGEITKDMDKESNPNWKRYLHSATASNPKKINALKATGTEVSDLSSYITGSYWSTKMNSAKNGYEWYPLLAKDTINVNGADVPHNRPIHVEEPENPLGLYKKWRVYVKTGEEGGLQYRQLSSERSGFDKEPVKLEDYEYVFMLMLTGSNVLTRGTELANDVTYGIKGGLSFYTQTEKVTDVAQIKAMWKNAQDSGKLGIKTGKDATNGSYIQFELLNPIDEFTAMYRLSSNLYSPLPESFIHALASKGTGENDYDMKAAINGYGTTMNDPTGPEAIVKNTICLGAYSLEKWEELKIVYKRNDDWYETKSPYNRYKIAGVHFNVIKGATTDQDAIYNQFNAGYLDSCGIPTGHLQEEIGQPGVRQTKGDSTFKLNVNSCTQEQWNQFHKDNPNWKGKTGIDADWGGVKPWMSNSNFLNGLFFSINRKEFAEKRGVQPSINYFSDAYLSDPENGVSYNSTPEHAAAIANYHTVREVEGKIVDNYGYNLDKAITSFKTAVNELLAEGKLTKGTKDNPKIINIHIRWMYQTDIAEYGEDIKNYFESAFNNDAVSGGTIKLVVKQNAVSDWEAVYNDFLMTGQFDLGFGAISGNTYSPLNFMEVLKSDNSSGFTLNWGEDTGKVNENNPLVFDGKRWSFDALWEVADHGGVVENGVKVDSVKKCEMDLPYKLDDETVTNDLTDGAIIYIPITFVSVPDVEFDITHVDIYIVGRGNFELEIDEQYYKDHGVIKATLSAELATELKDYIVKANKLDEIESETERTEAIKKCFQLGKYGIYWAVEVYYTISIAGGQPSQNYISVKLEDNEK